MTANARKFVVFVASLVVLAPVLATLLDIGPMGYHDGTALVVRLIGVLMATGSLAACIGIGAYIYWANVVKPAPRVTHVAHVAHVSHASPARRA